MAITDFIFDKDDMVDFREETHQYFTKFGDELESTTRVIGKAKTPFDRDGISLRMARGNKAKQVEILAEWDMKKDSSIVRGNWIHNNLEDYLVKGTYDPKLQKVVEQLQPTFKEGYRFYPEALIYSIDHKMAGQSDLVIQRQRNQDPVFDFYDYKTNEAKGIEFDSISRKKSPIQHYNRFMLDPLCHMEDCNFNHYALQLSIYAYMAQLTWNIRIGKLTILFIDNNLELHKIPVPYMRYEAIALMKYNDELKPLPKINEEPDEDDW